MAALRSTLTRGFTSAASSSSAPSLTVANCNPHVVAAQYAVRGKLVLRANQLEKELHSGSTSKPFDEIVYCNIGNPQSLGQQPITFVRQVLALAAYPELMLSAPSVGIPADAVARAQKYLDGAPGGTGAYSHSKGIEVVREEIADFMEARDGIKGNPENIFLTDGASPGVKMLLQMLIRDEGDGIMIPIPQYPLYSASIALCGGSQVDYYLNEATGWSMKLDEIERRLGEARAKGINVRALAVINPGNPTGQSMPKEDIADVIRFCADENIVLLADEVYQENIWERSLPFFSFRSVAAELGLLDNGLQLASFHSVSKGFLGECGRRGGYVELSGFDEDVQDQLYKLASVNLCSNLDGQIAVGVMVNPPKPGDESYHKYNSEKTAILDSLKRRASIIVDALNGMEGISCNVSQGALYAFPAIELPQAAVDHANSLNMSPDLFYCLELLEATGVVVVPGSGFGQEEGTFHFRTTILPHEDQMKSVIGSMGSFHESFLEKFRPSGRL